MTSHFYRRPQRADDCIQIYRIWTGLLLNGDGKSSENSITRVFSVVPRFARLTFRIPPLSFANWTFFPDFKLLRNKRRLCAVKWGNKKNYETLFQVFIFLSSWQVQSQKDCLKSVTKKNWIGNLREWIFNEQLADIKYRKTCLERRFIEQEKLVSFLLPFIEKLEMASKDVIRNSIWHQLNFLSEVEIRG